MIRCLLVGAALEALERLLSQPVTAWRGRQLAAVFRFLDATEGWQ